MAKSSPINSTHFVKLYPQNGENIVTIGTVTLFHPMHILVRLFCAPSPAAPGGNCPSLPPPQLRPLAAAAAAAAVAGCVLQLINAALECHRVTIDWQLQILRRCGDDVATAPPPSASDDKQFIVHVPCVFFTSLNIREAKLLQPITSHQLDEWL